MEEGGEGAVCECGLSVDILGAGRSYDNENLLD